MNWYDDHPPIPRLFHSEITLPVLKIKTTHLPVSMMVINSMFGGGGGWARLVSTRTIINYIGGIGFIFHLSKLWGTAYASLHCRD